MKFLALALLLVGASAHADWKNESEAGLVINYGNSDSQSLNAKHLSAYDWAGKNTLSAGGSFLRTKDKGAISAKRWDAILKYERALSDRFSLVASQNIESDRFAGYHHRYNTDVGPKYYFHKEEKKWEWFGEVGYRFTRENPVNDADKSYQKGRVYSEASWFWSDTGSTKFWVEFLPNFTEGRDWLLNSELSSSAAINSLLAFKVAYLIKYDNQPNKGVSKNTDGVVTTSLVAKF